VHKKDPLNLASYSERELKEFLPPKEINTEFGVPLKTLEYMRECSRDEGMLRGPQFLKDENIILYQRKSVVVWLQKKMFWSSESQETPETQKKTNSK